MKPLTLIGGLLLILGLGALVFQGITYTNHKTIIDIGPLHATTDEKETLPIPPLAGVACAGIGGALLFAGLRRRT